MKVKSHAAISAAFSGVIYLVTQDPTLSITSFLVGVFIDIDHTFEYLRVYGFHMNIPFFFKTFYEGRYLKIFLIFHSWELVVLLGAFSVILNWQPVLTGIFLGMLHHLIADQIYNDAGPFSYFILWRMKEKFEFKTCFYNPSYRYREDRV